jgi:hypothetical protein
VRRKSLQVILSVGSGVRFAKHWPYWVLDANAFASFIYMKGAGVWCGQHSVRMHWMVYCGSSSVTAIKPVGVARLDRSLCCLRAGRHFLVSCIVLPCWPIFHSTLFKNALTVGHSVKQSLRQFGRAGSSSRTRFPVAQGVASWWKGVSRL